MKRLRDYQEAATRATFDYFEAKSGSPLVVAPVGAGKSLLMAEVKRRACALFPETRFVVLSRVSKLLDQTAMQLLGPWPDVDISFCSDKTGRRALDGQVIVARIQRMYRK